MKINKTTRKYIPEDFDLQDEYRYRLFLVFPFWLLVLLVTYLLNVFYPFVDHLLQQDVAPP